MGLLVALSYARAGIVPASTTFLRQATTITHPSISYTQPISYSSPLAYSFVPSAYSQPLLSNAYYANPLFSSSPLVAHQPIYQYPGLVAQSPAVQYPFGPQGVSQVGVPHVEGRLEAIWGELGLMRFWCRRGASSSSAASSKSSSSPPSTVPHFKWASGWNHLWWWHSLSGSCLVDIKMSNKANCPNSILLFLFFRCILTKLGPYSVTNSGHFKIKLLTVRYKVLLLFCIRKYVRAVKKCVLVESVKVSQ